MQQVIRNYYGSNIDNVSSCFILQLFDMQLPKLQAKLEYWRVEGMIREWDLDYIPVILSMKYSSVMQTTDIRRTIMQDLLSIYPLTNAALYHQLISHWYFSIYTLKMIG